MAETGSSGASSFTRPLRTSSSSRSSTRLSAPVSSMPVLPVQGAGQFLPCTLSLLSGKFLESSGSVSATDDASPASGKTAADASAQGVPTEANASASENKEVSGSGSSAGASLSAKLSLERKKELLRHEILQNITLILNSHSHFRCWEWDWLIFAAIRMLLCL